MSIVYIGSTNLVHFAGPRSKSLGFDMEESNIYIYIYYIYICSVHRSWDIIHMRGIMEFT